MLTLNVVGVPAPQGSKRGFYNQRLGRVQMVESSKKVAPWRQDVQAAAYDVQAQLAAGDIVGPALPLSGAVAVHIAFFLPRPKGHYGTGRNAGVLKANAPALVDKKPDVDKLCRSTLDGLKEAGIYRDDSQVVDLRAVKRYADAATGARITIRPLDTVSAPASTPGADTVTTTEGALF